MVNWLKTKLARLKFLYNLAWLQADLMADAYFKWWERKLGKNKLKDGEKVEEWLKK